MSICRRNSARKKLIAVPWKNMSMRTVFTLASSRSRIFWLVAFRRSISCVSRPRLLMSSMLRRLSVVEPASAFVSPKIVVCTFLILRPRDETSTPRMGARMRSATAMDQWTKNE